MSDDTGTRSIGYVRRVALSLLSGREVAVMDRDLFRQLRKPHIVTDTDKERYTEEAAKHGIGYAVVEHANALGYQALWLIAYDLTNETMWRWHLGDAGDFDALCQDYDWLEALPQVFLVEQPERVNG